jgi:hypothetical protein
VIAAETSRIRSALRAGSGTPVFLWYKKAEEEPAIIAIQVLYGDEAVPAGFVKVAKDLKKGGDAKTYLCFQRATPTDTALPIIGVRILNSDAAGIAASSWAF